MGSALWARGRGPGPHAPTQPCRRAPGLREERAGGSLGRKLVRQALRASRPPVACCGVPMAMGYQHQRVEYHMASPRTRGSQYQAGRGEPGLGTGPRSPRARKGSGAQPSCTPRAGVSAPGRRPRMREERTALLLTEAPEINQRAAGGESAEIPSHASRGLCQ